MDMRNTLDGVTDKECRAALMEFLQGYLTPAFGALPKREVDLLVLELMERLGLVDRNPSLYSLVQGLRVTRSKARNLLYDRELRRLNVDDLDCRVLQALTRPLIQKQGDLFVLEIENPLVADHLRARLQNLGHATDGSFSASLVKLSGDAMAALIEDYMPPAKRERLRQALIRAGAPDTSLTGVLKSVFRKLGGKLADEAGSELAGRAGDYLAPIVEGAAAAASKSVKELFQ